VASAPRQSILFVLALLTACKSTSPGADGSGGTAGTGGTGGSILDASPPDAALETDAVGAGADMANDGTQAGADALEPVDAVAGPCATNLAGTWDLIAAGPGRGLASGVLVLGRDTFSLTVAGTTLTYSLAGQQAVWNGGAGPHPVAIQNTPGSVFAGSLPLSVGGLWIFNGRCELAVAPGLVTGQCRAVADSQVGGSDWPGSVPNPLTNRHYVATRTVALPSRFGDLGGQWQASADRGSAARCQATVSGNQVTFDCHDAEDFNGVTRLTIGNDCMASGTSSSGLQLSARRR
jgi:hypothetical protein